MNSAQNLKHTMVFIFSLYVLHAWFSLSWQIYESVSLDSYFRSMYYIYMVHTHKKPEVNSSIA